MKGARPYTNRDGLRDYLPPIWSDPGPGRWQRFWDWWHRTFDRWLTRDTPMK
jgi:hypothetical protein